MHGHAFVMPSFVLHTFVEVLGLCQGACTFAEVVNVQASDRRVGRRSNGQVGGWRVPLILNNQDFPCGGHQLIMTSGVCVGTDKGGIPKVFSNGLS